MSKTVLTARSYGHLAVRHARLLHIPDPSPGLLRDCFAQRGGENTHGFAGIARFRLKKDSDILSIGAHYACNRYGTGSVPMRAMPIVMAAFPNLLRMVP
jgi:hypothetical protein